MAAPRNKQQRVVVVASVALVVLLFPAGPGGAGLVTGVVGQLQAPAPDLGLVVSSARDDSDDADDVVVGDAYIGCLEMRLSRCFEDPTLICLEDGMVECISSLPQLGAAPAAPAPATGPAPAPTPAAAAALASDIAVGIIGRGIATIGASYFSCVETDLPGCYTVPTMKCVKKAFAAC